MSRKSVKKRKQSRICTFVILVSLGLLAGIISYKAIGLKEQKDSLAVQASELEQQLMDAQKEYKELEEKEEYMKTKSYVEDVARNQLGLVYPDEIVIRPEE
ncbi:MAG: septum formation initiator family protein [Coprococcus sp.]